MITILNNNNETKNVQMKDMTHGQVGVIVGQSSYRGDIVIRLDDNCYNLSDFKQGNRWTGCIGCPLSVRLFGPGEYIDVRISNDQSKG